MASSSSSVQQKHQVFLSFRGEDTRNNFTSHLYAALQRKGVDTFIDNQLIRGEQISQALLTAIEESTISIIVLSENYAFSSLCLDELSKILECKERNRQIVVPIFYHVDPSHVRYQKGSFEEAFAKHQERFKDLTNKVERWKAALVEVAGLVGHHLPAQHDRLESTVVEEIAEHILKKLMYKCLYDTRIEEIERLICIELVDVRIVGIFGMCGIGKTTTVEAVYNRFFAEFDGYSFLNVKEELKYGQVYLREKLISEILGYKNLNLGKRSLPGFINDGLHNKKFLIVLDDVDSSTQLDLLPEKHCFGPGSRVIIISRDKQVLQNIVDVIYEVEGLDHNKALQMFSLYAFKQSHPKQNFMVLSKKMVHYAKGVPLALKVLGSALYGRCKLDWQGDLNNLKEIPNLKIDNILRISFDRLDGEVKGIFLHIACFFKGKEIDFVTNILDGYNTSIKFGISVLIDKSLITISRNMIEMHDLLQEMAWNIVRQDSKEPGKCSQSWIFEDVIHGIYDGLDGEVKDIFLDIADSEKKIMKVPAPQIGNIEIPPEDGYTWRKYGQKEILGSRFPRSYYRCTHQNLYQCPAKKQVQRLDDDPFTFEVTYQDEHICHLSSTAPSVPPPPPPPPPEFTQKMKPTITSQSSPITLGQWPSLGGGGSEMHDLLQEMAWNIVCQDSKELEDVIHGTYDGLDGEVKDIFFDIADSEKKFIEVRAPQIGNRRTRLEDGYKKIMKVPAPQIGNIEIPPEDGYTWRKFGQKEILGSRFPRSYYRCTHQKLYQCPAKKQVQRLDDDPFTFEVTYRDEHICHMSSTAPSVPPPPPPPPPPPEFTQEMAPAIASQPSPTTLGQWPALGGGGSAYS